MLVHVYTLTRKNMANKKLPTTPPSWKAYAGNHDTKARRRQGSYARDGVKVDACLAIAGGQLVHGQ